MTKQQKLDAFARRKGYPSYFKYRDAVAKSEGFSSYSEKRRVISTEKAARRSPAPDVGFARSTNPALDMTREMRMAYRQAARTSTDYALQASRIGGVRERTLVRKESLTRPVIQSIDDLDTQVKDFYTNDFPKIYAAGARAVDPAWKGTRADRKITEEMIKDGAGSLIQNNQIAKRNARKKIPEFVDAPPGKSFKEASRRPIKGVKFKNGTEVGFEQYAEMVLRSNAATAYNVGFLNAAKEQGISLFIVQDGSGCGWTSHRDSEQAAGKVVTIEEALSHPIGHPNCIRTFSVAPKGTPHPRGGLFKREAQALKKQAIDSVKDSLYQEALSLVTHIATDKKIRDAAIRTYIASAQDFQEFKHNIEDRARLYEHARKTRVASLGNVTDLKTKLPPVVSQKDIADDVVAWMDDFADGREVPQHVLQVLGIREEIPLQKAVGDRMDRFNTMYNMTYRPEGPGQQVLRGPGSWTSERRYSSGLRSIQPGPGGKGGGGDDGGDGLIKKKVKKQLRKGFGKFLTPADYAQERAANAFYGWLGPRVPEAKFARITFPNVNRMRIDPKTGGIIGGQGSPLLGRPLRLSASLGNLGKVTSTSIRGRGLINHLSLNPNGLLRLSFARDKNGTITPTFRIIPKGPLRLMTKVNRGVRGNVTSLSTEMRFITKVPLVNHISGRFNINLRKLGIETLSDAKNITAAQLLSFTAEDIRGVSLAAGLRVKGFNLFDIAHTFRLPWEEAMKVWVLSNAFLSSQRQNLKFTAKGAKKFSMVQGGRLQHHLLGETSSEIAARRLTLLDPALAAPGGIPSQAQQIQIPRSLKLAAERRAYVESKLNSFERLRIQNLRLAGDYSTIRFLRDTDGLTFEDIAYRVGMSKARVEAIYRRGTTGKIKP